MGLIQLVDSLAQSSRGATDALRGVGDALGALDQQASRIQAPGRVGGVVDIGASGPLMGSGVGGGGRTSVVGSPLVFSLDGGPALTLEALEMFASRMDLPSGGWVYVFGGHLYPGSGGVLAAIGGSGSGGVFRTTGSTGGGNPFRPTGNQDRTTRLGLGGGRSSGAMTASADSTVGVINELQGVRSDLARMSRALEGDGGAGLRFGGGL